MRATPAPIEWKSIGCCTKYVDSRRILQPASLGKRSVLPAAKLVISADTPVSSYWLGYYGYGLIIVIVSLSEVSLTSPFA